MIFDTFPMLLLEKSIHPTIYFRDTEVSIKQQLQTTFNLLPE